MASSYPGNESSMAVKSLMTGGKESNVMNGRMDLMHFIRLRAGALKIPFRACLETLVEKFNKVEGGRLDDLKLEVGAGADAEAQDQRPWPHILGLFPLLSSLFSLLSSHLTLTSHLISSHLILGHALDEDMYGIPVSEDGFTGLEGANKPKSSGIYIS